jgi:hypothetical protein
MGYASGGVKAGSTSGEGMGTRKGVGGRGWGRGTRGGGCT